MVSAAQAALFGSLLFPAQGRPASCGRLVLAAQPQGVGVTPSYDLASHLLLPQITQYGGMSVRRLIRSIRNFANVRGPGIAVELPTLRHALLAMRLPVLLRSLIWHGFDRLTTSVEEHPGTSHGHDHHVRVRFADRLATPPAVSQNLAAYVTSKVRPHACAFGPARR